MPQHANQYPATHFQRSSIHKNIKELERLYFPTSFINCHAAHGTDRRVLRVTEVLCGQDALGADFLFTISRLAAIGEQMNVLLA